MDQVGDGKGISKMGGKHHGSEAPKSTAQRAGSPAGKTAQPDGAPVQSTAQPVSKPDYGPLRELLHEVAGSDEALLRAFAGAYAQASTHKGAERHAVGRDFLEQPLFEIMRGLGNDGFALGQALKKLQESERLPWERALEELRGAIVYLAAALLWSREPAHVSTGLELRCLATRGPEGYAITCIDHAAAAAPGSEAREAALRTALRAVGQALAERLTRPPSVG